MDIRLIETFDDSGVIAELDRIQKVLTELASRGDAAGQSVSDAMKKAGASSDNFTQSIEKNTKAVMENARTFTEGGRAALEQARDVEKLKREYLELKAAAGTLRAALKDATDPRAIKVYTEALGEADAVLGKLQKNAKAAGIDLKNLSSGGSQLSSAFKSVFLGSFASGGLTEALQLVNQVLKAGVNEALNFEQGLADLSALTGVKGADLDGLEKVVKNLQNINVQGKNIVTTGPEIERALSLVGGSAPELLKDADALGKITEQAIILSKTSKDLTLEDAVKAVTTSIGQFNLAAADGGRIINAYAAASKVGSVEVARLTRELADVGQVANLTGIGLEETLGAIELLGKAKIPEGQIGIQLRNIFTILADAKSLPDEAQEAFKKFGVNTDVLADKTKTFADRLKELQKIDGNIPALTSIFGREQLGGAAVLSTQADVLLNELIPGIKGTTEALDQAAIRVDTNKQTLENFKNFALNTLSDAFVDFGNDIGTVIGWFVSLEAQIDKIKQPIVDFFNTIEAQRKRVVAFLGFGPDLNPGVDNRTSLDPFAGGAKGDGRADIEKKIKAAQQQSLAAQIELNAARTEAGKIDGKNEKLAETAANKAKKRLADLEAELRKQEQFNKEQNDLRLQLLDPKSERFAVVKELQRFDDQRAAFVKHNLETEEIEKQHTKNLLEIEIKYFLERAAKVRQSIEDEQESVKQGFNELAAIATGNAEARKAGIEKILKAQEDLAGFREDIFAGQLLDEKAAFFAHKHTDKEIEEYEKEVAKKKEAFQLEQQRIQLQNQLAFNKDLSDTQKAGLQQQIENIDKQLGQLAAGTGEKDKKKKPVSILSLLGVDPDSAKGKAITEVANEVISAINSVLEADLRAAELRTSTKQKEYDEAKSLLEQQQQAAKDGNAADVQGAKDTLAQRRAAVEAAFEDEKKIRRQQFALETATQLSSLATGAAKTLAAFPGPLLPVGIGLVALMFASFAIAKSKALQAINQDKPKLRKGKFVEGPTHEGGGVAHTSVDGRTYEVEGKEAIIGTDQSKEHEPFLRAMIGGKFKGVNLNALVKEVGGQAPSPLSDAAPRAAAQQRRYERAKQQHQYQAMVTAYRQETTRVVDAINEKPVVYPWKSGYKKAVTKGKHTEIEVRQPGK